MIDIQPVERVNMTQRIDQIRRRITEIEEKIGIGNGDFQATLEREIARQAALNQVQPAQKTAEIQQLPGTKNPVNDNDIANAAKVAQALRDADKIESNQPSTAPKKSDAIDPAQRPLPGQEALPDKINQPQQVPPKINRVESPDTEMQVPSRDDKIFDDRGSDAELTPTEDLIMQTAYEYGVDPKLARAIAIAESDMNQDEISPVGAIGVMQLMPETAASLGVDPYNKSDNIVGGVRYIRQMLDTFDGDVPLAVAAYNAGPAAVQRYGGIPPYSETRNYVGRVMDLFQ